MPKKTRQQRIARFWTGVKISDLLACWEWQGTRMPFGYGLTTGLNGVTTTAHRVAWTIVYGSIPEGMFVLHKCDNPPCVNPNHLHIGTQRDNAGDAIERGRFTYVVAPRGTKVWSNKITEAQVLEIRKLAQKGELRQSVIAKRFGVTSALVSQIKLRRKWKHI